MPVWPWIKWKLRPCRRYQPTKSFLREAPTAQSDQLAPPPPVPSPVGSVPPPPPPPSPTRVQPCSREPFPYLAFSLRGIGSNPRASGTRLPAAATSSIRSSRSTFAAIDQPQRARKPGSEKGIGQEHYFGREALLITINRFVCLPSPPMQATRKRQDTWESCIFAEGRSEGQRQGFSMVYSCFGTG